MNGECIFCRIVKGELQAEVVYDDKETLAFRDIHPQAPVHIQIVPKEHIPRVSDLTPASIHLVGTLVQVANQLARERGVAQAGYRLVINCNAAAGQSVYHLHLHLLGGRPMQWPPG